MDFVKECIEERSYALMDELDLSGFSIEQARAFLPVAVSGLLKSIQTSGIIHTSNVLNNDPAQLVTTINSAAISTQLGLSPYQLATGFQAIAPIFLEMYQQSRTGLVGSLFSFVGGSTGHIINSTKKYFN